MQAGMGHAAKRREGGGVKGGQKDFLSKHTCNLEAAVFQTCQQVWRVKSNLHAKEGMNL